MRSRIWVLIALLVVVLAGAACGGTAQTGATPTPVRVARAPRPTFTVTPTKAEAQPATQAPEPTQAATLVLSPTITPTVAAAATSAPAAAAFTVNNPTVNVRQGPGTAYPIIGQVTQGQQLAITGKDSSGSWWQFNYNGDSGWVINDLVTVNAGAAGIAVAANIPIAPTLAPIPTARPAPPARPAPSAPPAQPTKPPAPATQFAVNGANPRVNTNPLVTVFCLVWNSSRNGVVGGTLRVTGGGQTKEISFSATTSWANAGLPSQFQYNTGCKIEIAPAVDGQYTAWLISGPGGQPISDPATLTVGGDIREFAPVWQQK